MNKDTRPVMVSVRCITYNHYNYLRQCLDSFLMQKTDFRFEIIVHDDASTDGTSDIVREYAEKYQDIIIDLSIIRETRGDDSFMIQTYPLYIKSPFNLKVNTILPYDESIAKYGLYIRYHLLRFINSIIMLYEMRCNHV